MRQGWRDLRLWILIYQGGRTKGGRRKGGKGDHKLCRCAMRHCRHYSRRLMTHVPFLNTTRGTEIRLFLFYLNN